MIRKNDTTFLKESRPNPKDRIEVEVGDSKQVDFHPQFKVKRWDNEVNFSARLKHTEANPIVEAVEEKVRWKGDKIEADFYELTEDEGGFEFEITLKEKPVSNVIEFTLNTKGLDFFYQPPLTKEEIKSGNERPDNVVGSYAVYASEKKTNFVGGKEYKTGKIGHIYRPKIVDSAGKEVWGVLNIDGNTLSVTIPQKFLDKATYPVRHAAGLTFGYTSQGASDTTICTSGGDNLAAQLGTAITGALTNLSAYVKRNSSNSNIQLEIWSNSGSTPSARLDGSSNIAVTSASYSLKTASVSESLTGSNYWAAVEGIYGGAGTQVYVAYDSGSGSGAYRDDALSWTANTNRYSVYGTYTIIALDSNTAMTSSASGSLTHTFSHTCSGSDRYLTVPAYDVTVGDTVTGVTYNGVAMTQLSKATRGANNRYIYMYGLVAPDTGTHDVVITRTGTTSVLMGGAISYNNVNQSTPTDGTDTDNGNVSTITSTIVTTVDNCAIVGVCIYASGSQAAGTGTIVLSSNDIVSALQSDTLALGTAGSKTIVSTGTSSEAGQCAVALRPIGGAAPSGPAKLKTLNTIVKASVKTYNTTTIAKLKTLDTIV